MKKHILLFLSLFVTGSLSATSVQVISNQIVAQGYYPQFNETATELLYVASEKERHVTKHNANVYVTNENLKLVLYKEGTRIELYPHGTDVNYIWSSVSPDGTKILFNTRKGTAVCDLEGNEIINLGNYNSPVWYGNSHIVAAWEENDGHNFTNGAIVLLSLDGKSKQILTDKAEIGMNPSASYTTGQIAYDDIAGNIHLMQINIAGKRPIQHTTPIVRKVEGIQPKTIHRLAKSSTATFSDFKIYINPACGGFDSNDGGIKVWLNDSTQDYGFWESQSNLDKGLKLYEWLTQLGFQVKMSRTQNRTEDDRNFAAIVAEANEYDADFMLSINSQGGGPSNYALQLYSGWDIDDTRTYSHMPTEENCLISRKLTTLIGENLYTNKITTWTREPRISGDKTFAYTVMGWSDGYGVLRGLNIPGAISEGSMHDYFPETYRLMNMDYKHQEAWYFMKAFCHYFMDYKQTTGVIGGQVRDAFHKQVFPAIKRIKDSRDEQNPLNGATIELLQDGALISTYITDSLYNGVFFFWNIVPGIYTLRAQTENHYTKETTIEVKADEISYHDFMLDMKRVTPPEVISYSPNIHELTDSIKVNTPILLNFNWDMWAEPTLKAFSISPECEGTLSMENDNRTLRFTPRIGFTKATEYTVTLSTEACHPDTTYQNHLQRNFVFKFRTRSRDRINLLQTYPADSATNISCTPTIFLLTDAPLNVGTLSNEHLVLTNSLGDTIIPLARKLYKNQVSAPYGSIAFDITEELKTNTQYTLTIDSSITDIHDTEFLEPIKLTFTTGSLEKKHGGQIINELDSIVFALDNTKSSNVKSIEIFTNTNKYISGKASNAIQYVFNDLAADESIYLKPHHDNYIFHHGDTMALDVYGDLSYNTLYAEFTVKSDIRLVPICSMDYAGWKHHAIYLNELVEGGEYHFTGLKLVKGTNILSTQGTIYLDCLRRVCITNKIEDIDVPQVNHTYTLTQNWLYSVKAGNWNEHKPNAISGSARAMIHKDGIIYFPCRDNYSATNPPYLVRVNAQTGEMLEPVAFADNIMKDSTGTYLTLPFNDMKVDNAGNVITSNLGTGASAFQIWEIDPNTGNGEVLIDHASDATKYLRNLFPDNAIRLDYIGVYGDITQDAIIMSVSSYSNEVYCWNIINGKWDGHVQCLYLTMNGSISGQPQVCPIEDGYFYIDDYSTYPILFDSDGYVVDNFSSEKAAKLLVDKNGKIRSTPNNGVQEFRLGDDYFLIMAGNNNAASTPSTFVLYKFKDKNRVFEEMTQLYEFPEEGMGSASNGSRVATPIVDIAKDGMSANIYVYTAENGYGSYTLTGDFVEVTDINLNQTTLKLTKGQSYQLNATILPSNAYNKNITWSTSNSDIVTIHDGLVVAVNVGTAIITATTENGGYMATCTIEVTHPASDKDSYQYPTRKVNGEHRLTNDWLYSNILGSFAENMPANINYARGMVAKDNIMYFPDRENRLLVRVDGVTGKKLEPIHIADNIFTQVFKDIHGNDSIGETPSTLLFNDIQKDNAGNILIGNLITNGRQVFQVWKIDEQTGDGKLIIEEKLEDNPANESIELRIDAFSVYGDVNNDAIIMAANDRSMTVFRWNITQGVQNGLAKIIDLYVASTEDSYLLNNGQMLDNPGQSPRIFLIDERYFYLDGYATFPTLFNADGYFVDDFKHCTAGVLLGNQVGDTCILNTGHNGICEFQFGGDYYLVMAATNTQRQPASSFALYKFKDKNRTFADMEPLWFFPNDGMGYATNQHRTAVPSVEINEAMGEAKIYVYTGENGYGCYTLSIDTEPFIFTPLGGDSVSIAVGNKGICTGDVVIPSSTIIEGIPYRVTAIADSAFVGCQGVSSVVIPNTITSIGKYAFYNCSKLGSVTIGKAVVRMGYYAFYGCTSLSKTNYTGTIASWCNIHFEGYSANPISNAHYFYINDTEVNTLNIPEGICIIPKYAFGDCTSITSVVLPTTLETISESAFYGCTKINQITVKAVQPPVLDVNTFTKVPTTAEVIVPCDLVSAYRAADGWNVFTNITDDFVYDFHVSTDDETKGLVQTIQEPSCNLAAIIKALPMDGYKFITWSDGNTLNMRQIKVDKDIDLSALFGPIDDSNNVTDVTVVPTDSTAVFTWPAVEGAASYTLIVWADAAETERICTLTFDAAGRLTNLDFSKRKPAKQQTGFGLNFTITGLEEGTTYGYTLEAKSSDDTVLNTEQGEFTTTNNNITTSVETSVVDSITGVQKIFENGTIYILRNGEKYLIDGRKVE